MLRWWGRRFERQRIQRELDRDFAQLRGEIARDLRGVTLRWRELERVDAELDHKRAELQALERRISRTPERLGYAEASGAEASD